MLYLFAVINLILSGLCGLSLYNIYVKETNGFLEMIILIVGLVLIIASSVAIIWVNFGRGKSIKDLKKQVLKLKEENLNLKESIHESQENRDA